MQVTKYAASAIRATLLKRYSQEYEERSAVWLASVITNTLLSYEIDSNTMKRAELHRALINNKIAALKNDAGLCRLLTDTVRVITTLCFAIKEADIMANPLKRIQALERFGLLIPGGDEPEPESYSEMVREFIRNGDLQNWRSSVGKSILA